MKNLKNKIENGYQMTKNEAMKLVTVNLNELTKEANELRKDLCGNLFDMCTIINGKSGHCSEDCKYCAQSCHYSSSIAEYPLLSAQDMLKEAVYNDNKGVLRYSVVTSGKRLTDDEVDQMVENYQTIHQNCSIELCASHGLLSYEQLVKIKRAGVTRYHNNLETSRRYFPHVCTTHTYEDKIATIRAAQKAGLTVCSGGIMGMGETWEDRIDMALTLRELGITSTPINILNPIPGTPYENAEPLTNDEVCRIAAIYRFLLPKAMIRMAGGRGLLSDKGKNVFCSGSNAAISGDMLTTSGITIDEDMCMLKKLGFVVKLHD